VLLAFAVSSSVFQYRAKRLAGKNVSEMTYSVFRGTSISRMSQVLCITSVSALIEVKVDSNVLLVDRSVLFFNRPRTEGWPHHGRTFSIYLCHLSF